MTITSRILAALLLASASASLVACSDDDDRAPTGGSKADGGAKADGGVVGEDDDAEVPDGEDASSSDAGVTEPEEDECPDGTTDKGEVCELVAPQGQEITSDLTLGPVKGKQGYLLSGGVFVGQDVGGGPTKDASAKTVTLTIKPGTTIFGGDRLAFLLINRGSKIIAEGTKDSPIVFTSADDPGKPGAWGGLILNGRAPCNQGIDVVGEANTGKYGGTDAADNSGVLKYVRVEFSGGKINDLNELNGIAFQGVGNGTTVDYIHVHAGNDDGVEFFGGTVNAKHVIVTAHDDDAFDWTGGYTGKIQFGISQQWSSATSSDPNAIEGDNNEQNEALAPIASPTFSNMTLVGSTGVMNTGHGMVIRRGTKVNIHNSVVLDFKGSCISLRGPNSRGFATAGDSSIKNSRISCTTPFANGGTGAAEAINTVTQAWFETAGNNNAVLADKNAALTDAFSTTAPDFSPKDSALLTAGVAPSDAFFDKVTFVGAVGDDDWTAGEWFKITQF